MSKHTPDYQDADLVIRMYELRREAVMRASRDTMNGAFWPRSYEEFIAVTQPGHPMNAAFRQVASYWEMVYGVAVRSIAHPEYLVENNAEGLLLYAKAHPYLAKLRAEHSPFAFRNAEWAAIHTAAGRQRLEMFLARIQKRLESA